MLKIIRINYSKNISTTKDSLKRIINKLKQQILIILGQMTMIVKKFKLENNKYLITYSTGAQIAKSNQRSHL